jgi:hypothetical protein
MAEAAVAVSVTTDIGEDQPTNPMTADLNPQIEMTPRSNSVDAGTPHGQGTQKLIYAPPPPSFCEKYMNKGDLSNVATFLVMVVGLTLTRQHPESTVCAYVLAFGLFGFAGGITNWLAVKMLFDKVPGLIGSGVIPRQFKAIRMAVKDTIMKTFFDEAYLEAYLKDRSKSLLQGLDLPAKIEGLFAKDDFDATLELKLTELSQKPEGMMLQMMAGMTGGISGMVPMIKPMLQSFGGEMGTMLVNNFNPMDLMSVEQVRAELDRLMEEKLLLLTPELVKRLMEDVIRKHLGWLIVWGNVFGALIGVASKAAGYG